MKRSWMDGLLRLVLVLFLVPRYLCAGEGKRCNVDKQENNTTYTESAWCDNGCCQDPDHRATCCDGAKITNGMIFGFIITGFILTVVICVYIRLRVVSGSVKHRTTPYPPVLDEEEVTPEDDLPEQDAPPPYWMCVSQPPALNLTALPPSSPPPPPPPEDQSPTGQHPPSEAISSGLRTTSAAAPQSSDHVPASTSQGVQERERISACAVTPALSRAVFSHGVLLQPSDLGNPSSNIPSAPGTSAVIGEVLDLAEMGSQAGTVVVFLPGQLSAEDRQAVLQSSDNSGQVLVYQSAADSDGSGGDPSSLSGGQSPAVSTDVPETASSLADSPSQASSEGAERKESPVKEILKRVLPGTVVLLEHSNSSSAIAND